MNKLKITNLSCNIDNTSILNDVNLTLNEGDCLALLGPNGHGKSTLLNVIMGDPIYNVTSGDIYLDDKKINNLNVTERAKAGVFLAFQNPPDVSGVPTLDFFRSIINSKKDSPISMVNLYKEVTSAYDKVGLDQKMIERNLNEGFSGGEKKRNELLQLLLSKPSLALLDEIDSGLDIDALNLVSNIINDLRKLGTTFIIVSHYDKLFKMVNINKTAVIINGKVELTGDESIANRISKEGYKFIQNEYNIPITKPKARKTSIGICGVKK